MSTLDFLNSLEHLKVLKSISGHSFATKPYLLLLQVEHLSMMQNSSERMISVFSFLKK